MVPSPRGGEGVGRVEKKPGLYFISFYFIFACKCHMSPVLTRAGQSRHTRIQMQSSCGAAERCHVGLIPWAQTLPSPVHLRPCQWLASSRRRSDAGRVARLRAAGVAGAGWTCGIAATLGGI